MFSKDVSQRLHLFDQTYKKKKKKPSLYLTDVSILIFFTIVFIPVMAKLNQQPLLQSSVSHDLSEISPIC